MQPGEKIGFNPFTTDPKPAIKIEEGATKTATIAGRSVNKTTQDVAELQDQLKKISDVIATVIPFYKKKIEEQERKIEELEKQLNGVGVTINNNMSQLTTLNSSLMTTITSLLGQIQGDFQRLSEQVQDSGKVQKEIQEQQATLLKIALRDAIKDGSIEVLGDEGKK